MKSKGLRLSRSGSSALTVVGFTLTCAVLLASIALTDRNTRRLADAAAEVDHSHRVVNALERLLSTLKDAETGQRGFVITGDPKFLEPYEDALGRVWGDFEAASRLTADDPTQQGRLELARPRVVAKLAELAETVALRRADAAAAAVVVLGGRGKAEMDAIRSLVAEVEADERQRMADRADRVAAVSRQSAGVSAFTAAAGVLAVAAVFALVGGDDRRRRKAAEAISEHKEHLRTTLVNIGEAVISTDPAGRVTRLNAVAEAMTGWTDREASGVPLSRVFRALDESTRRDVEGPATQALREGVTVRRANSTVLVARDGTERPIDSCAAPIPAAGGGLAGCVLVFRDISDRHQADAERRAAQRRVATTLDSVTDGFIRFDRDWRVVYVNAAAERLNRLPRDETLGKTVWELYPAVVGTEVEAAYRRSAAERVAVDLEHYYEPWDQWHALRCYPAEGGGLTVLMRDVTDRKRDEARLQASEARFKAAIEAVSSIVWTNDAVGEMVGEQPGWGGFTGQDREAYQGYGWSRAVHPDDAGPTVAAWEVAVDEKRPFDFEHRVRRRDGEWRLCSIRAVPVLDRRGEITEWVGVHTDITDQRALVQALRQSERFTTRLLDASPSVVYVFDLDERRTVYINARVRATLGVTAEEVLAAGEGFMAERVHPDDLAGVLAHVERVARLADGELLSIEYRMRHADGRWQWYANRDAVFTRTADGRPSQILGVATDVTERRRAEAALRASEVRYRRLFESAQDGILILDADSGAVTDANPYLAGLLGRAHAELLGKQLWEIGLFPDADAGREAMRELRAKGYVRHGDLPLVTRDGRRIDVESVSNVYGEGDHSVIQCNVRDITDRKRLQDSLQRRAAELSEADRRKDEFLATLAHELRNPLAPIRNGLHILRESEGGGKAGRTLAMMDRQLTHMVRLVDDLLDLSRISRGKIDLSTGRLELRTLVEAAAEDARPLVEKAGHHLAVALPDGPIYVEGDATRLSQVVANLLNNSAKYTHAGGRVRLALDREDGDAVVSVRDDGIPPAMLGRVFEMFTQVDRALERTTGGLGIGLSLVKGLVEMHGGTIEARSEGEGRGSEFVVRLPVAAPAPPGAEFSVGTLS